MKNIGKVLKDDSGTTALIDVLVILLVVLLIFMAFFVFYRALSLGDKIHDHAQLMLDAYTIQTGREIVQQVKSGNDYTRLVNERLFLKDFAKALEINEDFEGWQGDQMVAKLTNIQTEFILEERLLTKVTYTITLPLYFLGIRLYDVTGTVTIESRYNLKY